MKRIWFRRKWFDWGWYPATFEGWLITSVFTGLLLWNGFSLAATGQPTEKELIWFMVRCILIVGTLILICYRTGEKPRWQWRWSGEENSKNKRN